MSKLVAIIGAFILLLIHQCPSQKKDVLDMEEIISEMPEYENEIIIKEFNDAQLKNSKKYYLICPEEGCSKKDSMYVREKAMWLQDSIGVPVYRVESIDKANCFWYVRKKVK